MIQIASSPKGKGTLLHTKLVPQAAQLPRWESFPGDFQQPARGQAALPMAVSATRAEEALLNRSQSSVLSFHTNAF